MGYHTPCWIWQLGVDGPGYGQMKVNGKRIGAHRVYYERKYGPVVEGLELDHLCRNRACVNPDHLEPVTPAENTQRGVRARLSAETARAIHADLTTPVPILAKRYGVCRQTVRYVQSGEGWKNITGGARTRPKRVKTSRYIGVCWSAQAGKWRANIRHNGKPTFIGNYSSEEDAARAWDARARELRGDGVALNFPMQSAS